jgi:DNA-binding beta-propeller fold protein YncE
MTTRTTALFAAIFASLTWTSVVGAQQYLGAISTEGYGQGSGKTFGIAVGPDGFVYATLGGNLDPNYPSQNNRVVIRIDPATHEVVNTIDVGLAPRDIVFASPPGGGPIGIVANGFDRTLTIFDVKTQAPVATVDLQLPETAIPLGLVVGASQQRLHLSPGDGSTNVLAVDLEPGSATQYQVIPSETVTLASGAPGCIVRHGGQWLATTTAYSLDGKTAMLERISAPGSSGVASTTVLASSVANPELLPSSRDVAVAPDGIAYVVGLDMHNRVYGIDTASGAIVRAFPAKTRNGAHSSITLSPDGKIAIVCENVSGQISFIDVARGLPYLVVSTYQLDGGFNQPQKAVYSADGSQVFVAMECSPAVLVFTAPPAPTPFTPPLTVGVSNTSPHPGDDVHVWTKGATASEWVYFVSSYTDDAVDLGPWGVLHMTMDSMIAVNTTGGDLDTIVKAPAIPTFFGRNLTIQAIAVDFVLGNVKLSDELLVVMK